MRVVIYPGRRQGKVGRITLMRSWPMGPPRWLRVIIIACMITLWLGYWLPKIAG